MSSESKAAVLILLYRSPRPLTLPAAPPKLPHDVVLDLAALKGASSRASWAMHADRCNTRTRSPISMASLIWKQW
jgi:hypothetical protein